MAYLAPIYGHLLEHTVKLALVIVERVLVGLGGRVNYKPLIREVVLKAATPPFNIR